MLDSEITTAEIQHHDAAEGRDMTGHDGTLGTLKGVAQVYPKAVSSNMAGLEIHDKWSFSLEHIGQSTIQTQTILMFFLVEHHL